MKYILKAGNNKQVTRKLYSCPAVNQGTGDRELITSKVLECERVSESSKQSSRSMGRWLTTVVLHCTKQLNHPQGFLKQIVEFNPKFLIQAIWVRPEKPHFPDEVDAASPGPHLENHCCKVIFRGSFGSYDDIQLCLF